MPAMLHSMDWQGQFLAVSDMSLSKLGYARLENGSFLDQLRSR
ncbi:hypothetical protein [Lichenihabitans psoromatis]|nr:hypothetical protein [Lichenihabitans psoromatis]